MIGINRSIVSLATLALLMPGLSPAGQPQDYTTAETSPRTFIISGNAGLSGVVMTGLPGNPMTDANGRYAAPVLSGWTGKIIPRAQGCRFEPPSREYRNVTGDLPAEDYTVTGLSVPRLPGLGAAGTDVLVIPTSDVDARQLVETSEDLRVMLQILRETLSEPRLIRGALIDYGDFFGEADRAAEVFYLQGHAVLFVMRIDFPLAPTAAPPASEGEADQGAATDPVWQRARQKLQNPALRAGPAGQTPGTTLGQIKEALLQSLKHAANLRHIGSTELVIVTVAPQNGPSDTPAPASAGGSYVRGSGGWFEGSSYSSASSSFGPSGGTTQADSATRSRGAAVGRPVSGRTGPGPAVTVLTIQVKKSDIDAFAQGALSFEQFQQRARTFTY